MTNMRDIHEVQDRQPYFKERDLNKLLQRTITLTGNLQKTLCSQEEPGSIMGVTFDVPTSKQCERLNKSWDLKIQVILI